MFIKWKKVKVGDRPHPYRKKGSSCDEFPSCRHSGERYRLEPVLVESIRTSNGPRHQTVDRFRVSIRSCCLGNLTTLIGFWKMIEVWFENISAFAQSFDKHLRTTDILAARRRLEDQISAKVRRPTCDEFAAYEHFLREEARRRSERSRASEEYRRKRQDEGKPPKDVQPPLTDAASFDLLGLSRQCTRDEAKRAFRMRAKAAHPDGGGSNEEFIRVREALDRVLQSIQQ